MVHYSAYIYCIFKQGDEGRDDHAVFALCHYTFTTQELVNMWLSSINYIETSDIAFGAKNPSLINTCKDCADWNLTTLSKQWLLKFWKIKALLNRKEWK